MKPQTKQSRRRQALNTELEGGKVRGCCYLRSRNAVVILLSILALSANVFNAESAATLTKYVSRPSWKPRGGTARIPNFADVATLNPFMAASDWDLHAIELLYDPLVTQAPDLEYVGRLARDWTVSQDGLTWTFFLYENVTWHDGTRFTAKDCVFTFSVGLKNKLGRFADIADWVNAVEMSGNYTFIIRMKMPYAPLLYVLGRPLSPRYIVPEHIWSSLDATRFSNLDNPIGTGPFRLSEKKAGQYVKLKVNEKYHLGRPFVDEILFPIITNGDAMLLVLKAGEIDCMVWTIPYATVDQMKKEKQPNIVFDEWAETGGRYLIFQCSRYPTSEAWFRQMVAYCINATDVVNTIYLGYALPGDTAWIGPSFGKYYDPSLSKEKVYPYSLAKAAEILDSHGFKDVDGDGWRETSNKTKMELTLYSPTVEYDPQRARWGEMLANGMTKAGVKVSHKPLEWNTLMGYSDQGNFDMLITGGGASIDPDVLYEFYHSGGSRNKRQTRYSNPSLDTLIESQRKAVTESERVNTVKQAMQIISKELPYLQLVHQKFVYAHRTDKIDGWIFGPAYFTVENYCTFMNIYDVSLVKPTTTRAATTATTTQPPSAGGMGMETIVLALVAVAIVVAVMYYAVKKRK